MQALSNGIQLNTKLNKMIKLTLRIWILIIILILSLLLIFGFPPSFFDKGVIVKSVAINSTAFESGLKSGEKIIAVNNIPINNFQDYSNTISSLFKNNTGNKTINNTENNTGNKTINITDNTDFVKLVIKTEKSSYVFFANEVPPVSVEAIPKTRLKTGLDLQGGALALIKPEKKLNDKEMGDLIAVSNERFNVYGITDVSIKQVKDLDNNNFMLIEIAGASPKELESLISEQGKFEAKIGNETVFVGGNNDITYVCRNDAQCARIETCSAAQQGEFCQYSFVVHLSEAAAKRHANITGKLGINSSNPEYLDKKIDFYVDDKLTTSLFISKDLRGKETTQIQIQGSGSGIDRNSAIKDSEESMKKMQTILITGSMPYKLEIVKLDTISPALGERFTYMLLLTGVAGLVAVSIIVFIRYRNIKASTALLLTSFSEIVVILGTAALIHWNLDLPSIVGILVTIGTGVDQQIIILDEFKSMHTESAREKLKNALFIIVAAFFTVFVSLLPLFWAGAGLLKGFAITTMIGLTIGVLITRPAFADIIKLLEK